MLFVKPSDQYTGTDLILLLVAAFISANKTGIEDVVSELVAFANNQNESTLTENLITEFKKVNICTRFTTLYSLLISTCNCEGCRDIK